MEQNKFVINAEGEKLLVGSDVVRLADKSSLSLVTSDFDSFISYLGVSNSGDELMLCGSESCLTLWKRNVDYFSKPVSVCNLRPDKRLSLVKSLLGANLPLDDVEDILRKLKLNVDKGGVELRQNLENFNLNKITNVSKQKSQSGDFSYQISVQSNGKNDFVPPENLLFTVPAFENFPDFLVAFRFDLFFSFKNDGDSVNCRIKFECFDFESELMRQQKSIIKSKLENCTVPFFWGTANFSQQHDNALNYINKVR